MHARHDELAEAPLRSARRTRAPAPAWSLLEYALLGAAALLAILGGLR